MRPLLARLLRAEADLVRLLDAPPEANRDTRRIAAIRKQIAGMVTNLQSFADVVKFEFPPDRAGDMKLSDKILNAATTAAGVLIGIPTWPQKLEEDEQAGALEEIRKALENRLRWHLC